MEAVWLIHACAIVHMPPVVEPVSVSSFLGP